MDHPSGLHRVIVLVCAALAWSALTAVPSRAEDILRFGVDSVTLGWTPPPGGVIDGYSVAVSTNGGPYQFTEYVTEPRATLVGRTGDYIAVRVNAIGRTASGAPITISVPSEPSPRIYFLPAPIASSRPGLMVLHCAECASLELRSFTRPAVPYVIPALPGPWRPVGIGPFGGASFSALWHLDSPATLLLLSLATEPEPPTAYGSGTLSDRRALGLAEVDGDPALEVVMRRSDGTIEFWDVQGDRIVRIGTLFSTPTWKFARAADFDGDGISEIFWQTQTPGQFEIWKVTASRVLGVLARVNTGAAGDLVEVADFDGDGVIEPLWRSLSGELTITHLSRGSGGSASLKKVLTLPWVAGDWDLLVRGAIPLDDGAGAEIIVQDRWTYRVHAIFPIDSGIPMRSVLFDVAQRSEIVQVR